MGHGRHNLLIDLCWMEVVIDALLSQFNQAPLLLRDCCLCFVDIVSTASTDFDFRFACLQRCQEVSCTGLVTRMIGFSQQIKRLSNIRCCSDLEMIKVSNN